MYEYATSLSRGLKVGVREFPVHFQPDEEHKEITDYIAEALKENKTEELGEYILRAASLRNFWG